MQKINRLTVAKIGNLKHKGGSAPDKYYDGGNGLLLRIMPSGSKQWVFEAMLNGKRFARGLGSYPVVTLKQARAKALEYKRLVYSGELPPKKRKEKPAPKVPTFAQAADAWFKLHKGEWVPAHAKRAWAYLENHVFPSFGKTPVNEISARDVIDCLLPLREKAETMKRTRQRISAVMQWAIAEGYRGDNPAGEAISAALPKSNGKPRHFPAVPYAEVGAAIKTIRKTGAHIGTKLALEFLVLTATRSGEVRGAAWDEIDLRGRVWVIPAERMKTGNEHRVPLSKPAVEVLREARKSSGRSGLVFRGIKGGQLSDATMSKLMRENSIKDGKGENAVPHGFRSSFRDWAVEHSVRREVAESCLAHRTSKDKTEAAYLRSDLITARRKVMGDWASFITEGG